MKSDPNTGLLKTIVYGAGISMVGQISNLLLAAILQFIIARSLGAAISGGIAFGISLMTFFANLSLIGLDKGIVRFFPAYKEEPEKQINLVIVSGIIVLLISLLFFAVFWFSPRLISSLFPKQVLLLESLPYFLLLIPGNTIIAYLTAVTQALKKFDYQAFFIQIFLPILKIVALLWVIYQVGRDAGSVVLGFVLAIILAALLLSVALWRFLKPLRMTLSVQVALKSLLVFSLPLFFITIVDYGWSEAQILILGSLVSSEKIGIFNIALRLTLILTIFQTGFGSVFAPVIAELHQTANLTELSTLLKAITRWSASITIPFFLMMFCFAEDVMKIFGDEFIVGSLVLQVLALGIFLNVAVGPIGWFIVLTGRSYLSLINSCVALLVNVSVTFFLTVKYDILGAAIAILLGLFVINLMRLIQIRSIFGVHPFSVAMWKSVAAGCVVCFLGVGLGRLEWSVIFSLNLWGVFVKLIFSTAFITLVYVLILYLLRFDEYDKYVFRLVRLRISNFFEQKK